MRVAVVTFGCKLNQYDSARVEGRLTAAGACLAPPEEADLVLVNTCTVTHRADRDARHAIHAVKRSNPRARVAVLGCGTRRPDRPYRSLPGVEAVLSTEEELEDFLRGLSLAACGEAAAPLFSQRTRALLKVQEGCSFACTYCIVPAVRGPSRSVPPARVEEELRILCGAGYREVVLTGVNTGEYGKDLGIRGGLPALLERLLRVEGDFRLRLNSVEPRAVTPGLVKLLRTEERLCRHLQIPLQSGSDAVLRAMKRNYRSSFYRGLLERLWGEVPGIGLGADVLVGFPTETPGDFEATLRLVEASPLAFVHAFSYSPRPGTPAAALPAPKGGEVASRVRALRALAAAKTRRFAASFLGVPLRALTLEPRGREGRALTGNFLDLVLERPFEANRWVEATVREAEPAAIRADAVLLDEPRHPPPKQAVASQ
ncbi:MAG: MiaB/RimO family radical SAM methylthiotransferase [Acidobacteriota bacterium]